MYYYVILIVVCTWSVYAVEYTHHMILDADGDYKMWWTFNNDTITIKVTVKTTGWIGWGLSQNGKMQGADMVIGWLDKNGKSHFTDRHATGHHVPYIDKYQDYKLLQMMEDNGYTTMVFDRSIKLCNDEDRRITSDTIRVLYAWDMQDPHENKYINRHTKRGARSVYLLDYGHRAKKTIPKKHKTFDVLMQNMTLPPWRTAYWCKGFILPNMTTKHHLVKVEIVITPGNEEYVHHMLLYQCAYVPGESAGVQHHCYGRNMADLRCHRDIVIHGWAVGGTTYYYPKDVGLSLNEPGDPKYLLLEVHYDNRNQRSDIIDHSGLRFYYTDDLRKYDASVLATGISPDSNGDTQIIPQKQTNFTSYGFCSSACLNITNITKHYIFTAGLHSHVHGKKIVVRLIRDSDGVEVKRIAEDMNYDFNFQEFRYLREPVEIPPGHSIDIECTYSTQNTPSPVLSGLGTQDEMCLAYLFIYPKLNTRTCYSRSLKFYSWGHKEFGWVIDQYARIRSPVIVGGRNYNGERANKPLQKKAFWVNRTEHVRSFELAGATEPYWRRCSYAEEPEDSVNRRETSSHKPRVLLTEEKCKTNRNKTGSTGDTGTTDGSMELMPKLLLILLALCACNLMK